MLIFMYDNNPKHTAVIVREWFHYKVKKILPHLPQSRDLNSIEHLWAHIEKELRKRQISGKNYLKSAIVEIWENILRDVTKTVVDPCNDVYKQ